MDRWARPARGMAATRPCCSAWQGTSAGHRSTSNGATRAWRAIRGSERLTLLRRNRTIAFDESERPDDVSPQFAAVPPQRHALHRRRCRRRRDPEQGLLLGRRRLRGQRRDGGRRQKQKAIVPDTTVLPYPFNSGADLLRLSARAPAISISRADAGKRAATGAREEETRAGLLNIWQVMQDCVSRGCRTEGILPGGFKVKRRAADAVSQA